MYSSEAVPAYIGLGSNLENPCKQIQSARLAIKSLTFLKEQAFSSLYQSPPMGPPDQPDYVNAVMAITTELPPIDLLRTLQTIENNHGRIRLGKRWSARTLDLDIVIYGDLVINTPELTIPHTGLTERPFVLHPLYEIAPQLIIPGKGRLVDLLANCPLAELKRLDYS
jgi:2-amino-4-hydroxy-6-hydroxymethyldihydropteridine diphosphokinase